MIDWTIYDLATGKILGLGNSHDEDDAKNQLQDGQAIIIGEHHRDDLFMIVNGKPVPRDLSADELAILKSTLVNRIEREAGHARGQIITIADGQDYVYSLKIAEAERVIRDAAKPVDVPLIAAEAAADGMALAQKADQIVKASRQGALALSAIEVARRMAKRAVGLANTKSEAEAAAVIDWSNL